MSSTATSTTTREHTAAIAAGLVVVFHRRRNGQLGERWTPRRPVQLSPEEARRYELAAAEAQRVLQVVTRRVGVR